MKMSELKNIYLKNKSNIIKTLYSGYELISIDNSDFLINIDDSREKRILSALALTEISKKIHFLNSLKDYRSYDKTLKNKYFKGIDRSTLSYRLRRYRRNYELYINIILEYCKAIGNSGNNVKLPLLEKIYNSHRNEIIKSLYNNSSMRFDDEKEMKILLALTLIEISKKSNSKKFSDYASYDKILKHKYFKGIFGSTISYRKRRYIKKNQNLFKSIIQKFYDVIVKSKQLPNKLKEK